MLYTRGAGSTDLLRQYAGVFNAVEGNTTFYGVPTTATVNRWLAETPPGFRFCFKFPRTITHERRLVDTGAETRRFLDTLRPLAARLGPFLLQLPPSFGPDVLPDLDRFLAALPDGIEVAVEVRHRALFDDEAERRLRALLADAGADRVVFDARGLRAADASDPIIRDAQRRTPDLPVRLDATALKPIVRYMGHPEPVANRQLLVFWCDVLERWIAEGRTPHFFVHTPDDRHAPYLARQFHGLLGRRLDVGEMAPWPGEIEAPPPEQLTLFD
jgi:uncharacterized protein YecE (DUF72 family)